MDVSPTIAESSTQQQSQQHPTASSSGGPQIRSRITVVCAECKRLKLKCDRRTPCGSCTKRDTVARCIYSPAAAEKVDLHSLNNRLIQVESQLAQFTTPGTRPNYSCSHDSQSQSIHNDRALLAVGQSGSSLAISLEDVSSIWLDELGFNNDVLSNQSHSSSPSFSTPSQIKLEPTPVSLASLDASSAPALPLPLLMPPLAVYYASNSPSPYEPPSITPRLVSLLSFSPRKRQKIYDVLEDVLKMRPCFNWKHFKDRAEGVFKWASEAEGLDGSLHDAGYAGNSKLGSNSGPPTKEAAIAIFFGPPSDPLPSDGMASLKPTVSFFAAVAAAFALGTLLDKEAVDERNDARHGHGGGQDDTMSVDDGSSNGRAHLRRKMEHVSSSMRKTKTGSKGGEIASSPAALFSLSQQAMDIFKSQNNFDLDYIVACILQLLFLLHDGKSSLSHVIPPLVAQMVSIARTMGLTVDPDEFPGKYNLFEAEIRRRVWWDIFYYDLFVSDCMGQLPLIADNSFTTKMPVDVDEDLFVPASTSIPLPRTSLAPFDESTDFKYFGLKCGLARIVKNVKKRSFKDPARDVSSHEQHSIDQMASFENEVKQWLADLPPAFRLDMSIEFPGVNGSHSSDHFNGTLSSLFGDSGPVSPILIAQRCELAITANRLVLKVYLPFIRPSHSGSATAHSQAVMSTINAAHVIIHASRVLFFNWKHQTDQRHRRPIPGVFDFYSFGRTLFDAAVICAHGVIKQPTSVWARAALDDVVAALEVMRDPVVVTGRESMRGGVEGSVSEAVKIVELLKKKADASRAGGIDACGIGMKRKYDDVEIDTEQFLAGFQFPYVGVGVTSAGISPQSGPTTTPSSATLPPLSSTPTLSHREQSIDVCGKETPKLPPAPGAYRRGCSTSTESSKSKDKQKKAPYPSVGIRVRPGKEPSPLTRQCTSPTSASASSEFSLEPELRLQPPSMISFGPPQSQTPSHATTPVSEKSGFLHQPSSNQDSSPFCPPSAQSGSDGRMLPPLPQSNTKIDYPLPFGSVDHGHMNVDVMRSRKISINDINQNGRNAQTFPSAAAPTQAPAMYDNSHGQGFGSSSPPSYQGGAGTNSNGQLSNANSPYGTGGPSYAPNMSVSDPRSTPYREPMPNPPQPNYYSYDSTYERPMNSQNLSLATMNMNHGISIDTNGHTPGIHGGPGNMHTDSPRDTMYGYSSDKSHINLQTFAEDVPQPMSQVWDQDTNSGQNSAEFWSYYRT